MVRTVGEVTAQYATVVNNLAVELGTQGQLGQAEEWQRKSLDITREVLGVRPDYHQRLDNLAVVYWRQGQWDQVMQLHREQFDLERDYIAESSVAFQGTAQVVLGGPERPVLELLELADLGLTWMGQQAWGTMAFFGKACCSIRTASSPAVNQSASVGRSVARRAEDGAPVGGPIGWGTGAILRSANGIARRLNSSRRSWRKVKGFAAFHIGQSWGGETFRLSSDQRKWPSSLGSTGPARRRPFSMWPSWCVRTGAS